MVSGSRLKAEELWQIDEREECGAKDGEGGEDPEVAQQVGVDEQESGKGSDGGDAAQQDGLHLVAQQQLGVADILMVG